MPTKTSDASNGRATAVAPVTNLAEFTLAASEPYRVTLTLQGTSTMLFHRWNCEAVDAKAKAAKGSTAKKTDDVESYVYRNDEGELCIPGEYVRQSIAGPAGAAKFRQDPRSSRKSALDLYKAGVVSLTELASLGVKDWDMLDQRAGQLVGIGDFRPTYGRFAVVRFEIVP
jgi:hypothetical protein